MSYKKEMVIETTFTYDEELDVIGWFCPEAHREPKPIVHKGCKVGGVLHDNFCCGRGNKKYSVKSIKEVLGGNK